MTRLLILLGILMVVGKVAPTEKLVEALRRQLMNNNYDYMEGSDESDQITTAHPDDRPVLRAQDLQDFDDERSAEEHEPPHDLPHEDSPEHEPKHELNLEDPEAARSPPPLSRRQDARAEPSIEVSHRDLHYYIDDDHFNNNHLINKFDTETVATTARYKVLEVREDPQLSGRRSGSGSGPRRRFLQEERPDHIAIVPLDEGPIPEFRLPSNRRQYMGDYGSEDQDPMPASLRELLDPTPPTRPTTRNPRRDRAPVPDNAPSSHEVDPFIQRARTASPTHSLEDEDLLYLAD